MFIMWVDYLINGKNVLVDILGCKIDNLFYFFFVWGGR